MTTPPPRHPGLAGGRWQELSLAEQLANVGAEVGRMRRRAAAQRSAAFERARREAKVVLVAMDTALKIPLRRLEQAIAAQSPLVLIVPDLEGRPSPVDPAARVRRQLGLEA